jgi:hypothetical protein
VAKRIERAATEREQLQSEIMREALRFYIVENPHGIEAFEGGRPEEYSSKDGESAGESSGQSVYDPMGEH